MTKETEERKFLHDIAGPVGTAIFLLDISLESIRERKDADPEELKQLEQVYKSLEQIKTMIEGRREVLIRQGVPSSKVA